MPLHKEFRFHQDLLLDCLSEYFFILTGISGNHLLLMPEMIFICH